MKKENINLYDFEQDPQSDSNPFIIFRNRRIKKKYRKVMKKMEGKIFLNQENVPFKILFRCKAQTL